MDIFLVFIISLPFQRPIKQKYYNVYIDDYFVKCFNKSLIPLVAPAPMQGEKIIKVGTAIQKFAFTPK